MVWNNLIEQISLSMYKTSNLPYFIGFGAILISIFCGDKTKEVSIHGLSKTIEKYPPGG